MARGLWIEEEGALRLVINRGNCRAEVFRSGGARQAFLECRFGACARAVFVRSSLPPILRQQCGLFPSRIRAGALVGSGKMGIALFRLFS